MRRRGLLPVLIVLYALAGTAAAQENTCPALVAAAYAATTLECTDLVPGELCYGNRPLAVSEFEFGSFTRPGHRVSGMATLDSGPMNPETGEWGVALLSVQTNAPGQTVTMVVLGDVTLEDASPASDPVNLLPARVTFAGGTNLRAEPSQEAGIIAPLVVGQQFSATGKLADGSWLRVWLDDNRSGWVRADLVRLDGDSVWLPNVTPADDPPETLFSPLQAFTLTSAAGDAVCSAAPESGLLLQAAQPATIAANGVRVAFDGTLFLQAPDELIVHVLEGSAEVTSGEHTETAPAGNRIRLRYDSRARLLTTPRPSEIASWAQMQSLPLALLPREIEELPFNLVGVATPAAPDQPLLEGIIAESPCTVAAVNEVRLRRGPGVIFPIRGALYPGESARPDARAEGSEGVLWWRLAGSVWVRSDVVLSAGTCADLPLVEAPPLPTVTPAASAG